MQRMVVLVGGHILKDEACPRGFRTSTYAPADLENPYGIFGDSLRGEASVRLYLDAPHKTRVVVLGGVTPLHKDLPDAPHLSTVIRGELVDARVPEQDIVEIDMDPVCGTLMQLVELVKFLTQAEQDGETKQVLIVSNEWQLHRIRAMIIFRDELETLRSPRLVTRCVAAEDELIEHDPKQWYGAICVAYNTPAVRAMIARELKGASMIADGTYRFRQHTPTVRE